MKTTLCLIRHGETNWNAQRRLQGHTDIPLNTVGLAQAAATAKLLQARHLQEPFAALYSSDLQRAQITAHAIETRLKLTTELDPRLRERNFGALQGYTPEQAAERYPDIHPALRARTTDLIPPEGESLRQFADKVESSLLDIAQAHPDQSVLIVAHGGVLDIAYRLATQKPLQEPRDFALGNATLNWIEHSDAGWQLIAWDEREHLEQTQDELPG